MQIATQVLLEWPVFAAYELESSSTDDVMAEFRRWGVTGELPPDWAKVIRPRGTPIVEARRVLDINPNLHRQFAELPYEPRAYLRFAQAFGQLSQRPVRLVSWAYFHSTVRQVLGMPIDREPPCVRPWRVTCVLARNFNSPEGVEGVEWHFDAHVELQELLSHGIDTRVTSADDGRPLLALRLHDLRIGIAMQALRSLSAPASGLETRQCAHCGSFFEIGPGTRRRSTSKFCCAKCQGAYRYVRQKLEKEAGA